MMRRKLPFIIFIAVIMVVSIGVIYLFSDSKTNSSERKSVAPFQIKDLANPTYQLDSTTRQAVTRAIATYLSDADIETTNLTGVVRKNSYVKSLTEDGYEKMLLVDIPLAKRTYKVSSAEGSDGYRGLHVVCPSASEMIYKPFDCKDDTNG